MAAINYGRRRPGRNAEIPKGGLNQLARAYALGGAGGGLAGDLQGPALGTDEVIDGELIDNDLAPTALEGTATLPPPPHKKMGFGDHVVNVLTKGQHGQGFQSYNNAVDRAAYEAQLRGLQGQQAAAAAMERAKAVQAAMDARQVAEAQARMAELEAREGVDRRTEMFKDSNVQVQEKLKQQLAIDKAKAEEAIKNHLSPDLFESLVPLGQEKLKFGLAETRAKNVGAAQPAFTPAVIDSMMADYAKQGVINEGTKATTQKTLADADYTRAGINDKKFLNVAPGIRYDPDSKQLLQFTPPLMEEPVTVNGAPMFGGFRDTYMDGFGAAKVPGGLNAEFGYDTTKAPATALGVERGLPQGVAAPAFASGKGPEVFSAPALQGPPIPPDIAYEQQPFSLNPGARPGHAPLDDVFKHYWEKGVKPGLTNYIPEGTALGDYLRGKDVLKAGHFGDLGNYLLKRRAAQPAY